MPFLFYLVNVIGFILRGKGMLIRCTVLGLASGGGIHGLGALISGVQRGFFEVNFAVLGSVSPCTLGRVFWRFLV